MIVYDGEYALEAKTRSKSGITNLERPRIICKVKELFKSFSILSKKAHKLTQHNKTRNITAISHNLSEAKILSDINFICQIFFKAKCFSKFNVSQVLTKYSPMGYSQCITRWQ
jgi:hypothetical protein